jgi:hypothetical protein
MCGWALAVVTAAHHPPNDGTHVNEMAHTGTEILFALSRPARSPSHRHCSPARWVARQKLVRRKEMKGESGNEG